MMNALLAHERLHALLHDHGTWDAACSALGTPADGTAERALVAACRALAGNPHAGDADKVEEWVADPADADLRLAALACIYCSLRDADALTEVTLERRSAHASANNANAMLAELALALTQLAPDAEATTLVCTQAFEVAPEHPAATSAIIALSKTRADTPSRTYELLLDGLRQMTNAGRVHETAPLQRALGCWSRDELHDEILAEGHFARVFELDPDDEPTQRWLLQIWREAGDLARVGQVLATRVDQAPTDQTRARELLAHLDGVNEWQRWSDVFERWSCAHQSAAESSAIDSDLLSAEDLMLRHVSILRDHLNDSSAGESALTKARKRCPHSVSIAAASMAFGHPLDPAERAECATLVASACSEPARTIEAAEAWVKAGDPERAHTLAMSLPSLDELPCETLERVAEIAEQAHALDDATRVWVRAAECGTEDSQTAECFRRAALATQAEGGSPLPWLEAAVAAAPTRRDLVEALATEARRVEDWASARAAFAAICAMADIGADSAPPWEALAEAEMHLGHHDAAAAAWAKLIETRPEPPALQRGADALAEIATMEENWALLRALLPHHALLSGTDNATTAFALGRCFADENDTANARAWLSQVVALSPAHQGALRWLALHGEAESADAIIGLLRGTHEPGARFTLLLRLARARRSAGDWEGAVAAYELAAESDANAVEPLHHLLSLHMERQHWPLAIDVLARLSQRAPELALRLERTAGVLYLEELRDPQNAAHCFQRALRADPNDTESREALLAIHRASGDDDALAATLADLLSARADSDAALELGDLLVGRLGRYDDAVRVWRHAAASVTDPLPLFERITKAYPRSGKPDAQLMSEHRDVLSVAVDRPDSHYALFCAYRRERAYDRAWLHAAALRVLGDDAKPARDFVAEHRTHSMAAVRRPWADTEWDAVLARFGGEATWNYIAALGHWLQRVTSRTPADWGLDPRRDITHPRTLPELAEVIGYGSTALSLPVPALWLSDQHAGVMQSGDAVGALVLGPDIVSSKADRATAFRLLRGLALLHPRLRGVACVAHPDSLVALVAAAQALAHGRAADAPLVARWLTALRHEHADVVTHLNVATRTFEEAGGSALHAETWPTVVEQVACCVALTLTGSISQSIEGVRNEPAALGVGVLSDRLLDLLRFWVSDTHANLRADLGIGVG